MNFYLTILKLLVTLSVCTFIACSDDDNVDCGTGTLIGAVDNVVDARCGLENGSFELTVSGGKGPYEYTLAGAEFKNVQLGVNKIEGIPAGNYSLTLSDANGCNTVISFNLANQNSLAIRAVAEGSGCGEANGIVTIDASGGSEPYIYNLAGSIQSENIFSNLLTGVYTASITDANGCETSLDINVTSGTSYKDDIIPIIQVNCAIVDCHDGSDVALPNFTEYATVLSLAETIKSRTSNETMPPPDQPKLELIDIQSIACWVDDGSFNN